jgi:hypothetical protein
LGARNIISLLIILNVICINSNFLQGQNPAEEMKKILSIAGFENIRVAVSNKTLTLSYENNLYRNKINGLGAVIRELYKCGYDTLNIVTLSNDLPMLMTQINLYDWEKTWQISASETARLINVTYHTNKSWGKLQNKNQANTHIKKIDLVLYPEFYMMNVLLNRIYEVQVNIAPAIEVSLWRGNMFTGQVIFPVVNHFLFGLAGNQIRAGYITVAQEFRIGGNMLGRAVIGKFNSQRYGSDLSLTRYLFGGRIYLKANGGFTGNYQYQKLYDRKGWYRNEMNTLTWFLKGGYFHKGQNMQLDGSFGRYLNGDYGLRGDCTRYWGDTAVGFFAHYNGTKLNGGFHFAIPIGQKRYKKNRSFQMRIPSYFDWEYNAGTEFYYGQIYETRPNENRIEHFYNPSLIIKNLLQ